MSVSTVATPSSRAAIEPSKVLHRPMKFIPKKVFGFECRSAGGPSSTISPSRITAISSERNIASSWEWVT